MVSLHELLRFVGSNRRRLDSTLADPAFRHFVSCRTLVLTARRIMSTLHDKPALRRSSPSLPSVERADSSLVAETRLLYRHCCSRRDCALSRAQEKRGPSVRVVALLALQWLRSRFAHSRQIGSQLRCSVQAKGFPTCLKLKSQKTCFARRDISIYCNRCPLCSLGRRWERR